MISSRDMILGRIRASLNRDNDMSFDDDALKQRMRTHPRHPLPAFDEVLAVRFQQKIEAAHATVTQVDSLSAVTGEVIRYLDENSVARELVVSGETLIEQIDWRGELQVEQRLPTETDAVSVTSAFCAIAETGSLMLVSGERSATSLNFLPDYHIVILQTEQIMRHMEDGNRQCSDYERPNCIHRRNCVLEPSPTGVAVAKFYEYLHSTPCTCT
ncbi:MAG: LUD domain-containing protein, partial [Pseudomonadota bacterium]